MLHNNGCVCYLNACAHSLVWLGYLTGRTGRSAMGGVKRRQGDVPWDAVHRTLKLQYQPRRKVYTDDAVIAEPV